MWVYTTKGQLSIVQHFDKVDTYLVRSRQLRTATYAAELSAGPNAKPPTITAMSNADYAYRFECNRFGLVLLMTRLAGTVDYPNFKAAAAGNSAETGSGYVEHLHETHSNWTNHNALDFERFQADIQDLMVMTVAGTVELAEGK